MSSQASWIFERGNWGRASLKSRVKGVLKSGVRRPLQALGYHIERRSRPSWVYDPWQAQRRLLQGVEHPVVFDVGANVGQTLERYARALPGAEIHCFEPFPASYENLAATAVAHPRAAAYRIALGESEGEATFHVNPDAPTRNSLLRRPEAGRRYYKSVGELRDSITVPVETLDGFCARHGIDRVDVLKMDVQGAELRVLSGGQALLARMAIDMIYSEVMFVPHYEGGALFHEVHTVLREQGYSLYNLYDSMFASNGQLRYANALFLSGGARSRVVDAFPPEE